MSTKQEVRLTVRIKRLDTAVRQKKFIEAIKEMELILKSLEGGTQGFGGSTTARGPLAEREATVMASAVTSMLADEQFKMTAKTFTAFTQFKRALMQVFEVSGYRGTEHLVEVIGSEDGKGGYTFKTFELPKLFAGLSINALTPKLLDLLSRQRPEISWPLVIGYLSEQLLWNENAENARATMLTWGDKWKDLPGSIATLRNIGPAYMGCSYADADHKHIIKTRINALCRRFLENQGITDADLPSPRRAVKKRPTLVILAELYDSKHAMHRCYGPSIQSLRSKFKTVYMSLTGQCDDSLLPMFDKVDNTKFEPQKPEIFVNKVKSYRPDIVYFPSIGMRMMSIFASNVRMAPIQVMTFGHPATTYSEHIDYAILDEAQVGDPQTVNETILCRSSKPRFEMRADADTPTPVIRENPETVRIAVPAWSRKVTPQFLRTCGLIRKLSKKPVEFWFFPNGTSSLYQAVGRRLEEILPAKVFPRTNYNQYIGWLNQCDIFLSTFPFGATNGIVDGMRQGLPVVNMTGGEVHAANDSHIVNRFDQPDWLTTDSPEAYAKAVARLVNEDELRVKISEGILACDPDTRLIAQDSDGAHDFVDVMEAAYRFHEHIQDAGDKLWSYERLQAMLASAE
ncbi:MAG: hypothetical protein HWE25_03300 [Alphaproteobacteria bacterium]|nr:hypothetical protein [Alphaproteobacteria bacterium]